MPLPFKNPAGLYALLALIPFIFLYLRRPKPKEKTIPSLMFFIKEGGVTKFTNFFRQIFRNLLFLLQLAIILSVAFAAAIPFITSEKAAAARHTALVIDASASMNAMLSSLSSSSETRFEKAVEEAGSRLEGRVSIVLATNIPVVVLEMGTAAEARKILTTLKAKATQTHVGDSMLAAGELIDDAKGSRVVVLSDFQANQGTDVIVAKRSLAARGIAVEFVNILGSNKGTAAQFGQGPNAQSGESRFAPLSTLGSSDGGGKDVLNGLSNVGFVGLDVNKFQTTAFVKNYGDVQRTVEIGIISNGKAVTERQLAIGPRSIEALSFDTMNGKTELGISDNDGLETDNRLFISSPTKKVKALLITNSDRSYIMAALKSSPNVELDIAIPPVVRGFNYDAIIIHNASSQLMLPGFYKEINRVVANGTGLVVTAQDSLFTYVKQFDMPLELSSSASAIAMGNASKASVRIENFLTKGVDFGVVANYNVVRPSSDKFTSLVIADDNSTFLGSYQKGNGVVVYYGFFDDKSTFKSSYSYPIFWDNLLSFLTRSEDLSSFNVLTGKVEGISEQQVITPAGKVKTARLFFDEAGFYSIGSRAVAANLLSADESNIIAPDPFDIFGSDSKLLTAAAKSGSEVFFDRKLIFAALAVLLLELLIIKSRGDL